ncbi:MAG: 1-deoxy-D-xylulose-5-phosphate reductoisomerase, partial [Desulfobacterales bacterium]|nr:1-deoxy-D-xylulose-5-phosphate reductoisomerase [Desulfobacterales bacterium]
MKTFSILGATGSIGTSALKIVRMHPDKFRVAALTGANNVALLAEQIREFKPEVVSVLDAAKADELVSLLEGEKPPEIL